MLRIFYILLGSLAFVSLVQNAPISAILWVDCSDPNAERRNCFLGCSNCDDYRQYDGDCPEICITITAGFQLPCTCKKGFTKSSSYGGVCIPVNDCKRKKRKYLTANVLNYPPIVLRPKIY